MTDAQRISDMKINIVRTLLREYGQPSGGPSGAVRVRLENAVKSDDVPAFELLGQRTWI